MRTVLFLLAAGLLAQEPLAIKVDVRLVNVAFIVRDQSGALAGTLTKDDVEVIEDGVKQEVRFFGRSADLPLRLAMVVDVSGSQAKFNSRHQHDLEKFVSSAIEPRDTALLICFNNRIRVVSDLDLSGFDKRSQGCPNWIPTPTRREAPPCSMRFMPPPRKSSGPLTASARPSSFSATAKTTQARTI